MRSRLVRFDEWTDPVPPGEREVVELPADEFPRFADGARPIEEADEAIRRVGQTVVLVPRRIAHDVPALAAVVLPRDLRRRPQARLQVDDAIPGFGKGRT